jgi:aminoglycoside 6'-N-acetyltransferase I
MKDRNRKFNFICKPVKSAGFEDCLRMGMKLWPHHNKDLRSVFKDIVKSPKQTLLLCRTREGKAAGFANFSIRTDYVEGSNSSPVGYLEGIFVEERFRKLGVAKMLVAEGERWAFKKGCSEIGSDAELVNTKSHKFHRAIGFKEANRIVAFIRRIKK